MKLVLAILLLLFFTHSVTGKYAGGTLCDGRKQYLHVRQS